MKRTTATISLIAVLLLGLFAFGCGGDDDSGDSTASTASTGTEVPESNASQGDREAIEALMVKVRDYSKSANAEKFCDLFEPGRLEETLGREKCVSIFSKALKNTPKDESFKIRAINVDGDVAKVTLSYGDAYFEKIDGTWYAGTPDVGASDQDE